MHKSNIVVVIKANGKILREVGDLVYLPFGTEYTILIKNLDKTRRAEARVTIDNTDAGKGSAFVIPRGGEIELKRFIGGDKNQGNAFKFIERTEAIENARGIGALDGLIQVDFVFEQLQGYAGTPNLVEILKRGEEERRRFGHTDWEAINRKYQPKFPLSSAPVMLYGATTTPAVMRGMTTGHSFGQMSAMNCSTNDAGITVPGQIVEQTFETVPGLKLDQASAGNIVLKLVGQTEEKKVAKPVTVKSKPKCVTCHRVNKASAKFCSECGTSLTLI